MDIGEVKNILKGIIASSPSQMVQRDVYVQFKQLMGTEIPFRQHGFRTCEEFLRSLNDVIIINGAGPYAPVYVKLSSNSQHIVEMISKQKFEPKGRNSRMRNRVLVPLLPDPEAATSCQSRFNNRQQQLVASLDSSVPTVQNSPPSSPQSSSVPLVQEMSSLNLQENSLRSRMNGEETTSDSNVKTISSGNTSRENNTNFRVPFVVQDNLRVLIEEHPEGIWLRTELRDLYEKRFNDRLEFVRHGFKSLLEMCCSLPYILRYENLRKDDGKFFNANLPPLKKIDANANVEKSEEVPAKEKVPCRNPAPIPANIITTSRGTSYPPYVLLPDDDFPVARVHNSGGSTDLYIRVVIAEIYDLSKFWFNLSDNEDNFQSMMEQLRHFYNENYMKYKIPMELLRKQLYCVLYKGKDEFHRAVVVRMDNGGDRIRVFCVDTGTVETTTLANIYFLHRDFADLPRQGLRGRLAGLLPPVQQAQWTRNAAFRFLDLVRNKILWASIDCTDDSYSDWVYDVVLCLPRTGDEDIFVHDVLIGEGHAISYRQEQTKSDNLYGDYVPIARPFHLYPTFIELEEAFSPTATELRRLIALGVPLSDIYPIYFMKNTSHESKTVSDEREDFPLRSPPQRPTIQIQIEIPKHEETDEKVHRASNHNQEDDLDMGPMARFMSRANSASCTPSTSPSSSKNSTTPEEPNLTPQTSPLINTAVNQMNTIPVTAITTPLPTTTVQRSNGEAHGSDVQPRLMVQSQKQWAGRPLPERPPMPMPMPMSMPMPYYNGFPFTPPPIIGPPPIMFNNNNTPMNPYDALYNSLMMQQVQNKFLIDMQSKMNTRQGGTSATRQRNIVETCINEHRIKIVKIMTLPCVIPAQVQVACTGDFNALFLKRYLLLSNIIISDLQIKSIDDRFRQELLDAHLISEVQEILVYTCLANLPKLLAYMVPEEPAIPDFNDVLAKYQNDSFVWNMA